MSFADEEKLSDVASAASQQQSDWSPVWECFEKPHILFQEDTAKSMQEVVKGAVSEMRRYYSKKIVDVLVKVTRSSLEALRKRFSIECTKTHKRFDMFIQGHFYLAVKTERSSVFMLHSVLMIPKVGIKPNLDEVQDVLILAGKNITSVSKGVGQWTAGQLEVAY